MAKLFIIFYDNYEESRQNLLEQIPAPEDLRFSTKLHGGYETASAAIPGARDKSQWRYSSLLSSHMVIIDEYSRRVWEGRVEDVELTNEGVNIRAIGYFSHANEILHGLIYPGGVGTETYAHDIIIDTLNLTAQSFSSIRTWSTADAFIQQTDVDLGYHDFTGEVKAMEAIERALRYGYKALDLRPIYFALYNQRTAFLFPEPTNVPDFQTDIKWIIM